MPCTQKLLVLPGAKIYRSTENEESEVTRTRVLFALLVAEPAAAQGAKEKDIHKRQG